MATAPISKYFKPVNLENESEPLERPRDPTEGPNTLIVFTDGACTANGKKGARASYAVAWPYHDEFDLGIRLDPSETQTNNRGEYHALILAMMQANEHLDIMREKTLIVYTDSMLLIRSMNEWMPTWKRNGWKKADGQTVSNLDLLKTLDELRSTRKLVLKHVRAHTGRQDWESIFNDKVDRLARGALSIR